MTTVNARDPAWAGGAIGNGIADDTAALQAAINACIGPGAAASVARDAIATLYIPPGQYKITAPLKVASVRGLKIAGASMWTTAILPAATMSNVFDLNGLYACELSSLGIRPDLQGGTKVDNAVDLYWDVTFSQRSTQFTRFADILVDCLFTTSAFRTCKNSNTPQVDSIEFRHCQAYGGWTGSGTDSQHGFWFGQAGQAGANALCHWLYGCDFNGTRYGVRSSGISVNAWSWQSATTNGDATFYIDGAPWNFSANGGRSEGMKRLLDSTGFGPNCMTSLRDIEYRAEFLNADQYCININGGTHILVENCSAVAAGKLPLIQVGGANLMMTINGFTVGDSPLTSLFNVNATAVVEARGLTRVDATTGAVVERSRGVWRRTSGVVSQQEMQGTGSPEGVITAEVGSVWHRTDQAPSLYLKETGTGNTGWLPAEGGAVTVASASTIAVPVGAAVVTISGTTTINTITANYAGQVVTLVFQGILTVNDASNLKLASNFVTTADDTLTLGCDGTNWFEMGRSIN